MHRATPTTARQQPAPSASASAEPILERRRTRAERRSSRRRSVSVAVRQEVIATPSAEAELILAQSSDLGLGGMRIWRRCSSEDRELPEHTPLRLSFQLPHDAQLLEIGGEVVFDREPSSAPSSGGDGQTYRSTGVRFSELPEKALSRLRSFLEE